MDILAHVANILRERKIARSRAHALAFTVYAYVLRVHLIAGASCDAHSVIVVRNVVDACLVSCGNFAQRPQILRRGHRCLVYLGRYTTLEEDTETETCDENGRSEIQPPRRRHSCSIFLCPTSSASSVEPVRRAVACRRFSTCFKG